MLKPLLRSACLFAVRLFYPRMEVTHRERIPGEGPVIVVANHPNGLLDPLVVRIALEREIHFLAKSTLFEGPAGREAMGAFLAIPVYRAKEANTQQNEETFRLCQELLARRQWLALFPEGRSHSETRVVTLKTGAARIALLAESAQGFGLGVRILPVAITYAAKQTFRSELTLTVGEPFTPKVEQEAYRRDAFACATALTEEIRLRLQSIVLEADTPELWHGFRFAAQSMVSDSAGTRVEGIAAERPRSDAPLDTVAHELSASYALLRQSDPDRAEALVDRVRTFYDRLSVLGLRDPSLLTMQPTWSQAIAYVLLGILGFPLALGGALFLYAPYRLIAPLSRRLSRGEEDIVSTIKIVLGLVLFPTWFLAEGLLFAYCWGPLALAITLVLAPLLSLFSLRFFERASMKWCLLRLRFSPAAGQVAQIRKEQRELAVLLQAALAVPKKGVSAGEV